MAKRTKKRLPTWLLVIGLLAGYVGMAALGNAMLASLCFWSAIIVFIVARVRSSPKSMARQTYGYDDDSYDDDRDQRRRERERERDRRRREEDYQAMADAAQREREDNGQV